jgi:hypothetical protein
VDALTGGVAADCEFVVAVAEARLVAAVGGIAGAEVARQHGPAVLVAGGGLEVGPESAGADRRVLVRVADSDQSRAGGLDGGEEGVLFAGGGECGLVVDDRRLRPEDDTAVGDRGLERGERVVATVDAALVKVAGQALGGDGGGAVDDDVPAGVVVGAGDSGQRGALPGAGLPLDHHKLAIAAAQHDRLALLV